jgi:FixJ family two-component response regulator
MTEAAVYIVDDDLGVLTSLARLLRAEGYRVETYSSGFEFLQRGFPHVGCLLLDMRMPFMSGLDVQKAVRDSGSSLSVVFLSGESEVHQTVQAFRSGAVDFLLKPVDDIELLTVVEKALQKSLLEQIRRDRVADLRRRYATLSPQQKSVCSMVARGTVNRDIACYMGVSVGAVKLYRARAMAKLGVASATGLAFALEELGIRPDEGAEVLVRTGPVAAPESGGE